jgi:hypothetical protein
MKLKHLAIIAAILVSATAHAQNRNLHVETPEGRLILQPKPCQKGGKEATFIENRDNGGGGYGCWYLWNDHVYVVWNTFIGANGSMLRTDAIMTYPAPPELRR